MTCPSFVTVVKHVQISQVFFSSVFKYTLSSLCLQQENSKASFKECLKHLGQDVRMVDNAIHWINL